MQRNKRMSRSRSRSRSKAVSISRGKSKSQRATIAGVACSHPKILKIESESLRPVLASAEIQGYLRAFGVRVVGAAQLCDTWKGQKKKILKKLQAAPETKAFFAAGESRWDEFKRVTVDLKEDDAFRALQVKFCKATCVSGKEKKLSLEFCMDDVRYS